MRSFMHSSCPPEPERGPASQASEHRHVPGQRQFNSVLTRQHTDTLALLHALKPAVPLLLEVGVDGIEVHVVRLPVLGEGDLLELPRHLRVQVGITLAMSFAGLRGGVLAFSGSVAWPRLWLMASGVAALEVPPVRASSALFLFGGAITALHPLPAPSPYLGDLGRGLAVRVVLVNACQERRRTDDRCATRSAPAAPCLACSSGPTQRPLPWPAYWLALVDDQRIRAPHRLKGAHGRHRGLHRPLRSAGRGSGIDPPRASRPGSRGCQCRALSMMTRVKPASRRRATVSGTAPALIVVEDGGRLRRARLVQLADVPCGSRSRMHTRSPACFGHDGEADGEGAFPGAPLLGDEAQDPHGGSH